MSVVSDQNCSSLTRLMSTNFTRNSITVTEVVTEDAAAAMKGGTEDELAVDESVVAAEVSDVPTLP